MICAFHLACKPRSANKQPKPSYSRLLGEAARSQYSGPLMTTPLYSRIVWFHKYPSTEGDADNIAKRIHDALKGVLFDDDRLITHTMAVRVDATQQVEIIADPLHPDSAPLLVQSLADPEIRDILYVELGPQGDARVHLGPLK